MRLTTRICTATVVLAALAGLGACGDDGDATPTATGAPSGAAADCDGVRGSTVTVDIGDFTYDPDPVEARVCDSLVWTNTHDQAHTATGNGTQVWNTGNVSPDAASDPVVIDTTGSLTYFCALHPFMTGTVEVT